jgi:isopentenyl-diphosphate delta-isomerase
MEVIATGGIRHGLDVARAIALGARVAGVARNAFVAAEQGGVDGAERFFERLEAELRSVMLLCGARTVAELAVVPRLIRGELREWLADGPGPLTPKPTG